MKHLFLCLQCLFSGALSAQSTGSIENRIDSIVDRHLHHDRIVGLSIGIVSNGQVCFSKGYGTKKIGTNNPVDSTTNFLTASISKLFTATAIMQLCEQGKLDLSDKLTRFVPEFSMKDPRYKDITIYQLLTHTAGVPNFFNPHFIRPASDSLALTAFARKLRSKKLRYPPGVSLSKDTYSNSGYDLLGLVVERISGQVFSDYLDARVLQPVGMRYSSFFIDSIAPARRSTPHKRGRITHKVRPSAYYPDIPQDKPCGNLNSCTADLCRWMNHNLAIYDSTSTAFAGVLQRGTLMKMWTTTEKIKGFRTSIGLGWWIVDSAEYGRYLFHVGNDPGFSATLILSPANRFGIVVLCNGMYPMDAVWNEIPFEIIDVFRARGAWAVPD